MTDRRAGAHAARAPIAAAGHVTGCVPLARVLASHCNTRAGKARQGRPRRRGAPPCVRVNGRRTPRTGCALVRYGGEQLQLTIVDRLRNRSSAAALVLQWGSSISRPRNSRSGRCCKVSSPQRRAGTATGSCQWQGRRIGRPRVTPPSTRKSLPVVKRPSGPISKAPTVLTASGVPARPAGDADQAPVSRAPMSGSSSFARTLMMNPGLMVSAPAPRSAYWTVSAATRNDLPRIASWRACRESVSWSAGGAAVAIGHLGDLSRMRAVRLIWVWSCSPYVSHTTHSGI